MTHPSRRAAALAVVAGALLAACGSDDEADPAATPAAAPGSTVAATPARADGEVIVSAAASLKKALTSYGEQFAGAKVRLSFAGSDELAAQIRQGVKPDVFAAANTKLPDQLHAAGLVDKPVTFATNELVLAVPAGEEAVTSLDDLAQGEISIAVGADGVPVGDYTRKLLDRLPPAKVRAIEGHIRSREPDVGGIVGKLTQGAVDAGFVYRSDVQGAGGRLAAIELPDELKPTVEYGVALVKGGENPKAGQAFVDGLLKGAGADALAANGFGAP